MTDRTRDAVLIGSLTAIALALRFLGLSEGDFWADELSTRIAIVDQTPGDVLVLVQASEASPPAYYLLAWAWSGIFGASEEGLRSLSAIAGTLVAPVAYLTLRQLGLRTEALIAGGLAAVSPLLIWYSQEARVYSLFALLSALSVLFFLRVFTDFRQWALIGWSIASAAALLTHYFALFTIVGMAGLLLYRHLARWQLITLSLLPTAVAGFALSPTFAAQEASEKTGWISQVPVGERLLQLPEHFLTGLAYPPLAIVLVTGLLAASGGVGLLVHNRCGQLVGGALLGVLAITIALPLLAIAVGSDFVISRYLIGAAVPLLLAISVGLGAPRLRPVGPIIGLALVSLLGGLSVASEHDPDVERPSWGAAAHAIADGGEPDLVLACCGVPASPAAHYLGQYEEYDPGAMGSIDVNELVLATIRRPDHRPKNDFCWWGSPCQAEDPFGRGGTAKPGALSDALASIFDRVETSTRGSIKLERFRSTTPVTLGPQTPVRLAEDAVIVRNDIVNSVEVRVAPRLLAE